MHEMEEKSTLCWRIVGNNSPFWEPKKELERKKRRERERKIGRNDYELLNGERNPWTPTKNILTHKPHIQFLFKFLFRSDKEDKIEREREKYEEKPTNEINYIVINMKT